MYGNRISSKCNCSQCLSELSMNCESIIASDELTSTTDVQPLTGCAYCIATVAKIWRQFFALIFKNWLLKKRAYISTVLEFGLPVAVMALMVWIRISVPRTYHPASTHTSQYFTFYPFLNNFYLTSSIHESGILNAKIAFAPTPQIESMVSVFKTTYPSLAPLVITYPSAQALDASLNTASSPLFAGIIVDKFGTINDPTWRYIIRQNASTTGAQTATNTLSCKFSMLQDSYDNSWRTIQLGGGLLFIQSFVEHYFMNQSLRTEPSFDISWTATPFPTDAYYTDTFQVVMSGFFGIFLTLVYIWPVTRVVKAIVTEKEIGVYESMTVMGMSSFIDFLSWLVTYGIIMLIVAGLITAVTFTTVFEYSDPVWICLYFFLFGMAVFCYAYMMSQFFIHARVATTMSALLFLALFFPYYVIYGSNTSSGIKFAGCLHAPICMGLAIGTISKLEAATIGLHTNNLDFSIYGFSFNDYVGIVIADCVLYLLIAWLVNIWLHDSWGRSFRVTANKQLRVISATLIGYMYFLCSYRKKDLNDVFAEVSIRNHQASRECHHDAHIAGFVEPVSPNVTAKLAIRIVGLTKQYSGESKAAHTVVNNLTLDIYKGQILCLLGHNGAGYVNFFMHCF